ncbi:unnamed protein product [Prunus brigantina]
MRVLGNKSPIRKVRGLGSEVESDDEYVPSKATKSTYRSATPTRFSKTRPSSPQRSSGSYVSDGDIQPLRIPFYTGTDRLYSADDLYTIRQREDEPLWEYAARFSHEYSRCSKTDDRAAYGAFRRGSPYAPRRTDEPSAGQKRKDDRDNRQGGSKKGRGKYGRNDHRAPLPNQDRAQEVFTLLNTTYEAVLMNEHEIISKPNHRKPNRQDNRDTGKFC